MGKIRYWTEEEDKFLRDNYSSMLSEKIAEKLSRSKKAVQRRAHRLGIANKTPKITLSLVKKEFAKKGYAVLSEEYINSHQKIKIRCSEGHISHLKWNHFKNGRGCPKCYYDPGDMYDRIKSSFEAVGYTLLVSKSDYTDSKTPLDFICSEGHKWKINWNCFGRGQRCYKCSKTISNNEKEIAENIRRVYPGEVIENTKNVISPFELDIFIPEKSLAVEYCGLYWHSELSGGKDRDYHYNKYIWCKEKSIRLITIFEDEYLQRPEVVMSRIKHALGIYKEKIFARNTIFKEVPYKEARWFLDNNHLQGYSPSSYRFGLYKGNKLIQIMTFGRLSRNNANNLGGSVVEMKRLCSLPGVSVVGGASKLLKNSVLFLDDYDFIKSYCDVRWAHVSRPVYEVLGFSLIGRTKYTPHYTKRQKRFRNQSLRKTKKERETGLTEWQLRKSQGYDRIWDCGHLTYVYKIGD